ncbi:MAG: hypothetical protein K0S07_877 [Chlamydiales bacterium]|nr:hypothetical protein [Chlamydiales bacterium]
MRIFAPQKNQDPLDAQAKMLDLRPSDLIEDLFNNRESQNEQSPVKLRLSKSSRFLLANLKKNVDQFLDTNRSVAKEFDRIRETDVVLKKEYQNLRKMSRYLQWLKIHEITPETERRELESHPAFMKIHKEGKDGQIKEIFETYEKERQMLKDQQQRNSPNYYYLVYPATYAFN